jgi:site-specific recombinase XerD
MYLIKRNNGIYYIEFYDFQSGKTKRISTGCKNKTHARKVLSSFSPISLLEDKPKKSILLKDFMEEYIRFVGDSHSDSYKRSIYLSLSQFEKYVSNVELCEIDNKLVEEFIIHTYKRAKHSAALYHRTLKAAFNKAVDWEYIDANPFLKVKLPRIPTKKPIFINESEFENIIQCEGNDKFRMFYYMTYNTGLRLGELVNLKWSQIYIKESYLIVENSDDFITKSKKERLIPINNKLLQRILYYKNQYCKAKSVYVFEKLIGIRYSEDYISKRFKRAIRRSGQSESFHFHILRHSFASRLVQKGVSLYVVKELMGHSSISTTQIYSHLRRENLIEAIRELE